MVTMTSDTDHPTPAELVWCDITGMRWDGVHFLASADGRHVGYTLARDRAGGVTVTVTAHRATITNLVSEDLFVDVPAAMAECQRIEEWLTSLTTAL